MDLYMLWPDEEDPSPSLFSEEKEDPDKIKIDETEKILLDLKEACYKNSPTLIPSLPLSAAANVYFQTAVSYQIL